MSGNGIVCFFGGSAFDKLSGRDRRDYDVLKAAVIEDGGFSAFDATSSAALARMFDRLCADPDVEVITRRYPWVNITRRNGGA